MTIGFAAATQSRHILRPSQQGFLNNPGYNGSKRDTLGMMVGVEPDPPYRQCAHSDWRDGFHAVHIEG